MVNVIQSVASVFFTQVQRCQLPSSERIFRIKALTHEEEIQADMEDHFHQEKMQLLFSVYLEVKKMR